MEKPKKILKMSGLQMLLLNQKYDGNELCPHCGLDTNFQYNPIKNTFIICEHCGEETVPCSLCDGRDCNSDYCPEKIKEVLLQENDIWDDKINYYIESEVE